MLQRILLFCAVLLIVGCSSPENVMEDYIEAGSLKGRIDTVLDPERVKSRMEQYYEDIRLGDAEVENIVRLSRAGEIKVGEYVKLKVSYTTRNGRFQNTHIYYVKRTTDGYKVDWEASQGLNKISWKAYKTQRLREPMLFRVTASLSNYYNYEFGNAEYNYLSVKLNDEIIASVYGYVKRESQLGKRLYALLKDGEEHHLILQIRYLPVSYYGSNTVLIDSLVSEDWIY